MCNYANLVHQVLNDWVDKDLLFTGHDITKAVRLLTRENVRHSEVRKIVHDFMDAHVLGGSYLSEQIDVGQAVRPILYYPNGLNKYGVAFSPADYGSSSINKINKQPVPQPTGFTAPTQPAHPSVAKFSSSAASAKPDGRGRVCIPASLVRSLGFANGETAYIKTGPGTITVTKNVIPNFEYSYVVDEYSNIRLGSRIIEHAAFGNRSEYYIELDRNAIKVS